MCTILFLSSNYVRADGGVDISLAMVPVSNEAEVSYKNKDWLSEPIFIRHRYVKFDADPIWQFLFDLRNRDESEGDALLHLGFFDDVDLDVSVKASSTGYWRISSTIVARGDGRTAGFGRLVAARSGPIEVSLRVGEVEYWILPADDLPYYIVAEIDPKLLPDID